MTTEEQQAKAIEFKVDLVYKVVIVGMLAFAGRLSWQAWDDTQTTLRTLVERVAEHETRFNVNEWRISRNEAILGEPRPSK
jgi:hypothetical protein